MNRFYPMYSGALVSITVALLAFGGTSAYAAKNYYKWVDENGVTHYSERKPHDRDAERISVATGRSAAPEASEASSNANSNAGNAASKASQGETPNTAVAANDAVDTKDPERCAAARQNLKVLQENARVRLKAEDGSFRFLDENEKAEKAREAQDAINEAC